MTRLTEASSLARYLRLKRHGLVDPHLVLAVEAGPVLARTAQLQQERPFHPQSAQLGAHQALSAHLTVKIEPWVLQYYQLCVPASPHQRTATKPRSCGKHSNSNITFPRKQTPDRVMTCF